MNEPALPIVLIALTKDNDILLIKRTLGDYLGYFGLPGGKIEVTEHLSQSAEREMFEETKINVKFKDLAGIVSEHLWDEDNLKEHFLLFVCNVEMISDSEAVYDEDILKWYPIEKLDEFSDEIIPSDLVMIKTFLIEKKSFFFECDMKKEKDSYNILSE